MTANVDAMVREGIRAYREGKKEEGRALLEKAVELDQYNEEAWLWLSAAVDTPEEQRTCLENVLVINPDNEQAKKGLLSLGTDPNATKSSSQASNTSAFTTDSFDAPAAAAFTADAFGDSDFTSVEWGNAAPPSTPASPAAPATTGDQYDDWIDGLGIGDSASPASSSNVAFEAPATSAFDDDDLFSDVGFDTSVTDTASGFESDSFDTDDAFDADGFDTSFDEADSAFAILDDTPAQSPTEDSSAFLDGMEDTTLQVGRSSSSSSSNDPMAMFAMIPGEIKKRKLPGEKKGTPIVLKLLLYILVILNIGAIVTLIL